MSFFHNKNVTKFMGHHYAIWANDSNILLDQKKISASLWLALISGTGTALLLYIVRLVSQAIDKKCFQHKMCVKVHK